MKDEWHLYKYYKDSSYSIEVKAHGVGMLRFDKFTSKHDCILTIIFSPEAASTDTMLYQYNSMGKMDKLIQVETGRQIEIATVEYDSTGNIEKVSFGKGLTVGKLVYKNNKKGLAEEIKEYAIEDSKEEYMGKTEFIYEFHHL